MMVAASTLSRLPLAALMLCLTACQAGNSGSRPAAAVAPTAAAYTADGRQPLDELLRQFQLLSGDHGWETDIVYAYPGADDLAIRAWRTSARGAALWLLAGIHGEEPAGPIAIAGNLSSIAGLAASGVPIVVIPLCNPKGYRNNWRYPNTAARDWREGGYSVGDSGHLLPDTGTGSGPRTPGPPGPETQALTGYVLRTAASYPPRLVLDLHEDELSTAGGYIYSQGAAPDDNPVGMEIIRLLQGSGIALRLSGRTRFGEPIVGGVISRDDQGLPIRDGSIDELLASAIVFSDGAQLPGPAARTVIVVETPAFAGSRLEQRVAAQGAVLHDIANLWRLNSTIP